MDEERTKWNLLSEPRCTYHRGVLQPKPNGALQTLVESRSQKIFSTGESAVVVYNPSGYMQKETRQMRRNMWDIAREWRHKNWPKQDCSKFPSNTASSKWNPSWKRVEHRIGELRVCTCLREGPDDWFCIAWNQTSVKDCTWQTLCWELMRSLKMVQRNKFNEAIKIITNGLACKSLELNFLTVQGYLDWGLLTWPIIEGEVRK